MSDPNADPGWKPALRFAAGGLLPFMRSRRSVAETDGLVVTRGLLLIFCITLFLIGVVVPYFAADDTADAMPTTTGAIIVTIAGVAGLVARQFLNPPLNCTSEATLAGTYRTRFFVRMALAESTALVGFAISFTTQNPAMYALGAAFTVIGFWRLAPTAANLARDQEALNQSGCIHFLTAALRRPANQD